MRVPQWTERISNIDKTGEDHLGIETAAASYQDNLLPGIITVTDHARYYSLYCWILWRFIDDKRYDRLIANLRGAYFKRLELAHTMACYSHHKDDKVFFGGIIGSQRSGVIWRKSNPIDLDGNIDVYFQNKLGGFGQYYLTAMQLMGLIGTQPNSTGVYQLVQRGLELAQAYDVSIRNTHYHSALQQDDVVKLTYEEAGDYGRAACLCSKALAHGADRDLLREALFRLEDGQNTQSTHRARRLSLALVLDMVKQAGNQPFRAVMRYGLYLGDFSQSNAYEPLPALRPTYERWRQVQVRQLYTSALEILWLIFLFQLQDPATDDGITLEDFIGGIENALGSEIMNERLSDYLQRTVQTEDTQADWHDPSNYVEQSKFSRDALTVFNLQSNENWFTVQQAVEMLSDIFLRFYHLHVSHDGIWQELALSDHESHRLPMQAFFASFEVRLKSGQTFRDLISWLYGDYILSQHEYMAIRKLRYNGYDTFKFHYMDGRFYRTKKRFLQPIRHFALRLNNALNMLIDVGLVVENEGICRLSADGDAFLNRVEELNREH